jgi:S-adenosylmethionine synthetase
MSFFFTSESVSEGHPDKIADQISDAILDAYVTVYPKSKVACETLVTTNRVVIAGEINVPREFFDQVDINQVVRRTIAKIGYIKPEFNFCDSNVEITNLLHQQSPEIAQGVDRSTDEDQGAGDQGIMFGYATDETPSYLPLPLHLSHLILKTLAKIRHDKKQMQYLRPDAKTQVTVEYDSNNQPIAIDTILISTQHDEFASDKEMLDKITLDIHKILLPLVISRLPKKIQNLFTSNSKLLVNPTGKFVIGGPDGDAGLTGRKIIVDTYGGKGAHGGGAFSGKDPSKVDRSAAYMARYIAKNIVASGQAKECIVQISYAIGVAKPISFYLNTYGTNTTGKSDEELSKIIFSQYDLRPAKIIEKLKLLNPIYSDTAAYGHFGRECEVKNGLEYFTWEKIESSK